MSLSLVNEIVQRESLLKAQVKEAKAEAAMWRALANEHRNTIFKLRKELQDLHEEVDGLYEQASELKYD